MYTLHSLSPGLYKLGLLLHGDLTDALEDSLDKVRFLNPFSNLFLRFSHIFSFSHCLLKSMSELYLAMLEDVSLHRHGWCSALLSIVGEHVPYEDWPMKVHQS